MATAPIEALRDRAATVALGLEQTERIRIVEVDGTTGAGSLAVGTIPDIGLAIACSSAEHLAARLRRGDPPVVARIHDEQLIVHMRAIDASEDAALREALRGALMSSP
jgi:L-seryl-tRNA(Ser) seleniumtransferase